MAEDINKNPVLKRILKSLSGGAGSSGACSSGAASMSMGPKFDEYGHLIPYTILGTWEDFVAENNRIPQEILNLNREIMPSASSASTVSLRNAKEKMILGSHSETKWHFPSKTHSTDSELLAEPTMVEGTIRGPAMYIGNKLLAWTSAHQREKDAKDDAGAPEVAIQCDVVMESYVGEKCNTFIRLANVGTTRLEIDWQLITDPSPFPSAKLLSHCDWLSPIYPRFTADVLRPRRAMKISVCFYSEIPGVFRQVWQMFTRPALMQGCSVFLKLYAVAIQPHNIHYNSLFAQIDKDLDKRVALQIVSDILNDLVDKVRSPPVHTTIETQAYVTIEEVFCSRNGHKIFYKPEAVDALESIHKQIHKKPWNLSVDQLRQNILAVEDYTLRENLITEFYAQVSNLQMLPITGHGPDNTPGPPSKYFMAYKMMHNFFDKMESGAWVALTQLGLIADMSQTPSPPRSEDRKSAEERRKERKIKMTARAKAFKVKPTRSRLEATSSIDATEPVSAAQPFIPPSIAISSTNSVLQSASVGVRELFRTLMYLKTYRLLSVLVEDLTDILEDQMSVDS